MPPRQAPRGADTIRILVATDSHVGYNERDATRKDDSWSTFDEVMRLAKEHDVDMILHGGDLFHENVPSRKSMYQVMRSLRMNCLGDKPCELEMLSDASENIDGVFAHVNWEDPDINVAIPMFAIHGNHDDPSGEGQFAALDILQVSGLVNYYGRMNQSDNIAIKPVLLQKGRTKLALYGMSNIRDERLFRTFREGHVKFYQPGTQKDEWFNIMSVHQNHHAYTETSYLPENFLPEFMDLVVWGHEHECLIEPRYNPEMGFNVIQPGSSIATSLMPGEAVAKHVCILSVTGKEFQSEAIRLKTVRPFVMKEIVLAEERAIKEKELWRKTDNRSKITAHLTTIVDGMIEEAQREWLELQEDREEGDDVKIPLPLVRLRVEYTAPEGGEFQCENPQRFSNRFLDRVANSSDVVQFYRKKKQVNRALKNNAELPDEHILAEMGLDSIKVGELVKEFLEAQSLTILPQNSFGDAVAQFVDKDDKHAVTTFVEESLANQMKHLLADEKIEEEEIPTVMGQYKETLEGMFASGQLKKRGKYKLKPKPPNWDSDFEGPWEEQPVARYLSDDGEQEIDDDDDALSLPPKSAVRGRGKAAATTRKTAAAKKPATTSKGGRSKKKAVEEEDDDDDIVMIDDDDEEEEEALFVKPTKAAAKKPAAKTVAKSTPRARSPPKKAASRTTSKQSTLSFSQSSTQRNQPVRAPRKKLQEPSDDEISDDDDAFEPVASTSRSTRARW